ncbi:MAG: cyclic nucleotide-binding domain-containing protein [Myxococcales bacterium]|nr:cyclic nucleotide-binding domain-containing protein [Myxococcales bacterium]
MSDAQAVLEELLQLPLCDSLGGCDPEAMAALAELGRIERFGPDEVLFEAGAPATELRFVVSGRVALSFRDPAVGVRTIGSVSPGDLLGWSALREGATWSVGAHTTKPTRCITFSGDELRALCDRDRELGFCLMRFVFEVVAQRLADCRVQLLDLYGRPR